MNTCAKILMFAAASLLAVSSAGAGGPRGQNPGASDLTEMDEVHLIFMRSEEKLARDVYLTIAEMYPDQPVFSTIAERAEQTHTDTVAAMLANLGITDPEPSTTVDFPPPEEQLGVFENPIFERYFEDKYDTLVNLAAAGPLDALYVGATIEELDMLDIDSCNEQAFGTYYPGLPDPCGGLSVTDVRAIRNALGNLLAGSENHLCAFVSQIGPMLGDGSCYSAQVLTQEHVAGIIEARCIEFIGYVCPPGQE